MQKRVLAALYGLGAISFIAWQGPIIYEGSLSTFEKMERDGAVVDYLRDLDGDGLVSHAEIKEIVTGYPTKRLQSVHYLKLLVSGVHVANFMPDELMISQGKVLPRTDRPMSDYLVGAKTDSDGFARLRMEVYYKDQRPVEVTEIFLPETSRTRIRRDAKGMLIVHLKQSGDVYRGGEKDEVINGSDRKDVVYPGAGRNSFRGGRGNDEVHIQGGVTVVEGGADVDTVYFPQRFEDYLITRKLGRVHAVSRVSQEEVTMFRVEELRFSSKGAVSALTIPVRECVGTPLSETVTCSEDTNWVDGGLGDDVISAFGRDNLFIWRPGDGNDTIIGAVNSNNMRRSHDGRDTLHLSEVEIKDLALEMLPEFEGLRLTYVPTNEHITLKSNAYPPEGNQVEFLRFDGGGRLRLPTGRCALERIDIVEYWTSGVWIPDLECETRAARILSDN